MPMIIRLTGALLLIGLVVSACGDDATEITAATTTTAAPAVTAAPTTSTTSTTAAVSTTVAATTTTTAAPSTTATTTTEADGDAWVDGSTVLRAGDCFIKNPVAGEDSPDLEAVPCDTPHLGEIVSAGSACPEDIDQAEFAALVAEYVGVAEDEVFGWMDSQQIWALLKSRFEQGRLAGTMCYIEGDLNRSYRATTG